MWLKILRQNLSQLTRRTKGTASIEQKNGNGNAKGNKTNNNEAEVNRNEDQNGPVDIKAQAKKKPAVPGSGPLLQQTEVSSSQLDFFKMLDEKIENGPDYDEALDAVATADRVSGLLRRWELASMTWSSLSDLNNTTTPSTLKSRSPVLSTSRQNLSAKDREGMRNIVGGRPESAPVFVRNANRVDGLQEAHHCPSPNMPRHVLESITQSPTQSLKNTCTTTSNVSPTNFRYSDYKEYGIVNNQTTATSKVNKIQYQSQNAPIINGEYVNQQQALYREQYLQQTGIVTVPGQYSVGSPGVNVLRNSPYVQQFQISSSQHYPTPRKRAFNNAAQMT